MTAPVATPDTPARQHRSNSQLSNYLTCGWQYKLAKIDRLPERPSVWQCGGRAFHSASEEFDQMVFDVGAIPDVADTTVWEDIFTEKFEIEIEEQRKTEPTIESWRTAGRKTTAKPNGEDIAWWHIAGRVMIGTYVKHRANTNDNLKVAVIGGEPAIEVQVTVPIGDVPMLGYIDRVMEDEKGTLVILDLKTGARIPYSKMQLALYSVQLEQMLGRPVSWGMYYDARKGSYSEYYALTKYTAQNLGVVYSTLDRAIREGIFLPNVSDMCKSCAFREHCVFGGTATS